MRRLLRPICLLIHHDWAPPVTVRESKAFAIFHTHCNRCLHDITGDWDWMEVNHAWNHERPMP